MSIQRRQNKNRQDMQESLTQVFAHASTGKHEINISMRIERIDSPFAPRPLELFLSFWAHHLRHIYFASSVSHHVGRTLAERSLIMWRLAHLDSTRQADKTRFASSPTTVTLVLAVRLGSSTAHERQSIKILAEITQRIRHRRIERGGHVGDEKWRTISSDF